MTRAWQRLSLRARLIVVGAAGVAVALAIGSIALYTVLTVASYRTLDDGSSATARDVASLVDQGRLPEPIPVTGSEIVQVVDSSNRVVSASTNADQLTAVLLPREIHAALAGSHVVVSGSRAGLDSPLRVVAVPAHAPGGNRSRDRRTVVVAQQFDAVQHSQHILKITLLATYPLLLAALGLIAWRVVGATLRPVEELRSSAERISGTGQDGRLPVPASGDEIHALSVTLNSMLDRLADSRARQRAFVADAAHELRSPLASMQTQLDVARRLGETVPTAATVEDLQAELVRMSGLVEDLLMLARLDADTLPAPPPRSLDVRDWVEKIAARHGDARVPVCMHVPDPLQARGQPDELHRALANLVDNAVRHAATKVDVRAYPDGSVVAVAVTDDGAGIPAAEHERVFERFTRLDDARDRDAGGSGLGLSIVRELVRRSAGTVAIEPSPRPGLTVVIRVPLAP